MRLKPLRRLMVAAPAAALLSFGGQAGPGVITAHALTYDKLTTTQKHILSGFASAEMQGDTQDKAQASTQWSNYYPTGDDGCPQSRTAAETNDGSNQGDDSRGQKGAGRNIKVNPDCLNLTDKDLQGRAQAQNETAIAQDPRNPNHVVAFYNNYQRGDGGCIGAFSLDGGKNWGFSLAPHGFTRGQNFQGSPPREYWQAGGDTSVAWDTKGNAYLTCQVFNRGNAVSPNSDQSSGVYVYRSTKNAAASWNFPGRAVVEHSDVPGAGDVLEDKPYMTVDNNLRACSGSPTTVAPGSNCTPFQDRVYVAYTEFAADGSAYIWATYSNDYGEHFQPRRLVSRTTSLCFNTFGAGTPQGTCNENQFADPFVGPDGTLYIVYSNFNNQPNTGPDNRYQMLLSKSTDGGNTFTGPVKVADYYDLPDCPTYQMKDPGRSCVPEKGPTKNSYFRAANYPTGSVNPNKPNEVVVTYGSYINRNSNEAKGCVPTFFAADGNPTYSGVKAPGGCNNDIQVSVSENSGTTFTGTARDPRVMPSVTNEPRQRTTDQWWQWQDWNRDSGKLAVSYYDRQYGSDETTGYMDFSLSGTADIACLADTAHLGSSCVGTVRVTTSSMPPPTQFAGTFLGDYTGLTALRGDMARPLWTDTRNPDLFLCPGTATGPGNPPQVCTGPAANAPRANDEDAFTAILRIPSGPRESDKENQNQGEGG